MYTMNTTSYSFIQNCFVSPVYSVNFMFKIKIIPWGLGLGKVMGCSVRAYCVKAMLRLVCKKLISVVDASQFH